MKNVLAISIIVALIGNFAQAEVTEEVNCSKEQTRQMKNINETLIKEGLLVYSQAIRITSVSLYPKHSRQNISKISEYYSRVVNQEYPDCANSAEVESFKDLYALTNELENIKDQVRIELLLKKYKVDLQVDAYRSQLEKELQGANSDVQLEQKTNPNVDTQSTDTASEGRS